MIENAAQSGKPQKFEYVFNADACLCFVNWLEGYEPDNQCEGSVVNPLSKKPNKAEYCISQDDYESIFTHTLGPDCKAGTADDTVVDDDCDEPLDSDCFN